MPTAQSDDAAHDPRAALLRVVTADLAVYQRLEDDELSALPGVQRLNSTLVMKHVVQDRPLPA